MPEWDVTSQELSELVTNRDSGSTKELYDKWGGPEGLAKKLKTDLKHGLSNEGAYEERIAHFGPNSFPKKPAHGFFAFWFEALQDHTLIILMVAAIFSIGLNVGFPPDGETRESAWIEGFAILVAVALVSGVTAGNDWSKDRKFRQLSELTADRMIKVIREGKQTTVSINDILVGDVVILETGDYIPADLVYIYGQSVSSDEAPMTGEPEAINKTPEDPWFLSGCMIMEGFARGIVVATGSYSQWGKIKSKLDEDDEDNKTPLQEKLEELAENIGKIGIVAAVLTLTALILRWTIEDYGVNEQPWAWQDLTKLIHFFITAVTIIVVAVPEGLPLAVTLALAYSMFKMMKDQNLVRHLAACETMGGATCICSDKTGTLTQNRMTVTKLWMAGSLYEEIPTSKSGLADRVLNYLNEGIAVNSSAYIEKREEGLPVFVGAKTECALLVLSDKLGSSYEDIRKDAQIVRAYPFSSKKKRMSTLIKSDSGYRLYTKGASEVVLDLCTEVLDADGDAVRLDDEEKAKLMRTIEDWAGQGLRTLSLTVAIHGDDLELPSESEKECHLEQKLILVAIVGIEDPLRDEVPGSVETCKRAGIKVRMLTGDNILTASSIGRKCGILTDGIAIEGPKFRKMTMRELDQILPKLQIIARCSPEDKLKLVNRLKDLGEVVAVTGDGTNDSPALKAANVGFAMGISGTEVAKDASDIILLDDNFSSIEKAVLWGRNVYDAIRKFIQFQLTVNIVAVTIAFIGAVTGGESPLSAVQMLWVNLIMDTMAALALATEPPTPSLLDRPPHGRHAPLITFRMWRTLVSQALLQLFFLFFILYGGYLIDATGINDNENEYKFWYDAGLVTKGGSLPAGRPPYSEQENAFVDTLIVPHVLTSTIIFNTFVFCQIFNEFNARRLENEWNLFAGVWKNYFFCVIWVITIAVQIVIVEVGGPVTQTTSLNASQWGFCIITSLISIPFAILVRFIPMPSDKYLERKFKPKDEVELSSLEVTEESQAELRLNMETGDEESEETRPRTASQNWRIAQGVMTKVGVIAAFRKPIDYRTSLH